MSIALDKVIRKQAGTRIQWGKEELSMVLNHYSKKIKKGALPGKADATRLIAKNAVLKNRTWKNVKDFVRNHITEVQRPHSK